MKVYFGTTTTEFPKYKDYYYSIRDFLVAEGHIITRDWIERIRENDGEPRVNKHGTKEIYDETIKGIYDSDLVIVEDTVSNFSTGHIITLALQRKIPTLVLWLKNKKHMYYSRNFLHGIDSEYLEIAEYTLDDYKEIIRAFAKKHSHADLRHRFHLVVNDAERKYLDWAQFNKHKSRTNIIREAIRKSLNEDIDYQEYLRHAGK